MGVGAVTNTIAKMALDPRTSLVIIVGYFEKSRISFTMISKITKKQTHFRVQKAKFKIS